MINIKGFLLPGLITGLGLLLVSAGFNFIINALFPGLAAEYVESGIFRPWSDPLMQLFFVYPILLGVILSFFWGRIKILVKGGGVLSKGINFGLSYFLAATLPGMFVTYTSFEVSLGLVLSWTISGLFEGIAAGLILAKLRP